jgi:hypothetical protein
VFHADVWVMVKPDADIGGWKEEGVGSETDEGRMVKGPGIAQGSFKSVHL